MTEPFDKPE